ncbi:class I SAM-dependent methyltransferase [Bradyrhizobium sp.]|uniref:class I SAM-dependent methyltransferase n=1 Tax=Bradyrhizobium sp. TaxID=376 RepID=UPI003C71592D
MDDSTNTANFFDLAIERIGGYKSPRDQIRILDFGAGSGRIAKEMSNLGYDVFGCDIIAPPPDMDPRKSRQIQQNPYRLPYDDAMFDIVMSTSVLEHARNPEEYMPEMRRVLKPGGAAMHLLPGKWYLPYEPHILVPLANYFYPNCPTWWFAMFAFFGHRAPGEKGMNWRETTQAYRQYYDTGLFYLSTAQYEKLSTATFGNYEWPMEFYIDHAGGGVGRICRKLPFKKLLGKLSREIRMGFLVQRKNTSSNIIVPTEGIEEATRASLIARGAG